MGTFVDDLAVWNELGFVTPSLDEWLKFPIISNGAHDTFRLKINCNEPDKINSYILLRCRWTTATTDQVEQSIRIYPRSHVVEKLLFKLPINQELLDRSNYLRAIEVKKIYIKKKYLGVTSDTTYAVQLEELWG